VAGRSGHHRAARTPRRRGRTQTGRPDSPAQIENTRGYLKAFLAAAEHAQTHTDLYTAVLERYPDRINRGVLWNSARTVRP
jgi:hypothetical protein